MTETYDSIIIGGEAYKLANNVKVVTWEHTGAFSFPRESSASEAATNEAMYGFRRVKGKPIKTLPELKEHVQHVVLHTDLTGDSEGCFRALVGRKLSTHFMIDWDGTIYQPLDVMFEAYHGGDSNSTSVGIDLNNLMRNLVREPDAPPYDPKHPRFADMSKREYRRPRSRRMKIQQSTDGQISWGYTDAQYQALIELLKVLTKVLDKIEPKYPADPTGEVIPYVIPDDWPGFAGILAHWHISPTRWDPGPGFDWQRVIAGLAREHNAFPIELEDGKNVATLLEPDKVRAYAQEYFRANESALGGGWYPIGINQTWHGGIHLKKPKGSPVYNMFDGVVVAGRFGKKPTRMGHNNFLVLRHEIDVPTRQKEKTKAFVFYSLYMHLGPIDFENVTKDHPEWVRQLFRVHGGKVDEEETALQGGAAEEEDGGGAPKDDTALFQDDDEFVAAEDDDGEFDTRAYLEVGQHLAAFKRGEIALVPWKESPVKISSGELIGDVGLFGKDEYDQTPQIHVEIFAEEGWKEAVDLGVHGRFFSEVESDLTGSPFVDNRDVLSLFDQSPTVRKRSPLLDARVVAPDDIEYFFTTPGEYLEEKSWLRKVVARHVSEWSDQVDWVLALSRAETWDERVSEFKSIFKDSGVFRGALRRILPFVWLNKDVAAHIGLNVEPWTGIVYHFHPIHFLVWMTFHASQRIQVISSGMSLAQLRKLIRDEEKKNADKKARGERVDSHDEAGSAIILEDLSSVSVEGLLEDWRSSRDQGEWKLPTLEEI